MNKILLSRFKSDLAFIENPENYYAMFKNVIDKCASAQLGNILLYEEGHFTDEEYTGNVSRIQRAKERAIVTHGEWTIKAFERSKTQHTPRTFVSSVYSAIWGIELPGEPGDAGKVEPQVKKMNFKIENISCYEDFLKKYFDAYEISGASDEWTKGWCAAIAWCKKIVDEVGGKQ